MRARQPARATASAGRRQHGAVRPDRESMSRGQHGGEAASTMPRGRSAVDVSLRRERIGLLDQQQRIGVELAGQPCGQRIRR